MASDDNKDARDTFEDKMDRMANSKSPFMANGRPKMPAALPSSSSSLSNNPLLPIISYCGSSILMTCTNKYVLSGRNFNLNFFLLTAQAVICVVSIQACKTMGIIKFRDFNTDEAKKWFPISLLLIGMIYTSTKALAYLSIPVYTIFKNLTIILIAYGEVLWFGGNVSSVALGSFVLMVLSSLIAAWADIKHALETYGHTTSSLGDAGSISDEAAAHIATLNAGYIWMMLNCFCSAAYLLGMRKRIKLTNFKDFDTMYYNNLLSIPILIVCSLFIESWSTHNINLNFPEGERVAIFTSIIFSGLSSLFISYTSAWCVRVASSTTYSMVGALNKLPIAVSGLIFFDAPVTVPSVSAIAVGFLSGVMYTFDKVRQSESSKRAAGGAGSGSIIPMTERKVVSASGQSMRDSLKA